MGMAAILAEMPELRRKFLAEHAPDAAGRCRECRNGGRPVDEYPCLPYRIALEAQRLAEAGPRQLVRGLPRQALEAVAAPPTDTVVGRRLRAVPAASWGLARP